MMRKSGRELEKFLKPHGRTFCGEDGALWFNWTCSGFTVCFLGSCLKARIRAIAETDPGLPGMQPVTYYPWVGVTVDGGEDLSGRFECGREEGWYTLYEGEEGRHTVRIIKLSENIRGKTALLELETDGELLPAPEPQKKMCIEFIGDSITCGFGNEAPGRDDPFLTSQENGWMTYGAAAARELGAEFSCVSVSGISTARALHPVIPHEQMDEIYDYTDLFGERILGSEPSLWDFKAYPTDIIVVNLGTNDRGPICFRADMDRAIAEEEEKHFRENYRGFIEKLRRLNGPEAYLCCTLGPLDHFLYDDIRDVVEEYRRETGDERITAFKLLGVNLLTEGYGAISHPSLKTQMRMGRELAGMIRRLVQKGEE